MGSKLGCQFQSEWRCMKNIPEFLPRYRLCERDKGHDGPCGEIPDA